MTNGQEQRFFRSVSCRFCHPRFSFAPRILEDCTIQRCSSCRFIVHEQEGSEEWDMEWKFPYCLGFN